MVKFVRRGKLLLLILVPLLAGGILLLVLAANTDYTSGITVKQTNQTVIKTKDVKPIPNAVKSTPKADISNAKLPANKKIVVNSI